MANNLPITLQMGALPPQVRWTPQQLAEAMIQRMSLVTQATFALFVTGSTEPSSNVGPWLKNGTEWWVWSNTAGAYVPITIEPQSLGYYIGSTEPDPAVYQFWIETTVGGAPVSLNIYYNGAWTSVGVNGEYLASTVLEASGVALVPSTPKTVTSITLTPGDWDVSGVVLFQAVGACNFYDGYTLPLTGSISLSNNALGGVDAGGDAFTQALNANGIDYTVVTPIRRISVATSTVVYLVAGPSGFSTDANAAGTIRARRFS
jgi:hypothetical protein